MGSKPWNGKSPHFLAPAHNGCLGQALPDKKICTFVQVKLLVSLCQVYSSTG